LPEGSVAALGLGSKAVLFITGLTGAAITSVVLPYFSAQMAQNRLLDARRELSFLLLAGTIVSIPITLVLHVFSGTFVSLLFEGGAFGAAETALVSKVMAYGVLQLPFFVINILLLKFAIASHRSGRVLIASMIGLVVSVAFSLLLMPRMGVPGIALAMTFAAAASAAIMLLLFCRLGDVAWVDLLFIVANWALFLTAMVCLHYASYAGAVAAAFAYMILMLGEWAAVTQARQR
jgi:putative peptidoglycan lipid II flippase